MKMKFNLVLILITLVVSYLVYTFILYSDNKEKTTTDIVKTLKIRNK